MFISSALVVAATVAYATASAGTDAGASIPLGECAGKAVVVDYGPLGVEDSMLCVTTPTPPMSARDVLEKSGVQTQGTARFPGFVCRVNGKPSASQPLTTEHGVVYERCSVTPSAQAYWSVWTADTRGSWTYSNLGVEGINIADGQAIGLVFHQGTGPVTGPAPTIWSEPAITIEGKEAPHNAERAKNPTTYLTRVTAFGGVGALALLVFLVWWRARALRPRRD